MHNDLDSLDNFLEKKGNPKIGVIGAGKLGLCLALNISSSGKKVPKDFSTSLLT